jgi:hypothetical protein
MTLTNFVKKTVFNLQFCVFDGSERAIFITLLTFETFDLNKIKNYPVGFPFWLKVVNFYKLFLNDPNQQKKV